MKFTKTLFRFGAVVLLASVFASCGKMGGLPAEYITVNPNPLEVKANKVEAEITGTFPEKYFAKKAILEVTPVLRYEGGEAVGTTVIYQGEKVKDNNKVVAYKTGGKFTQNISFDYVPGMKKSKLFLTFKAKIGKKEIQIPEVEIAQGTIVTATLANPLEIAGATGADAFQRVIQEKYEAAILFQIQRAELQKKALTTAEVAALQKQLTETQKADNKQIASLGIASFASPDGPTDLNEKLAANRKKNTENFLTKELKKSKLETTVDAKFIAEDWDGFQELMMQSDIQDKELIIRVLSMYNDPAQREKEIKNLSAAYTKIADQILPQLRRSKLELVVDVIGKSDEQILAIAKAEPSKLSLEELLYGASIATSASEKAYITGQAISLFPEDWRAYNNLATLKFADGNVDEAKALLATAVAKGGDQPQVNFNLGLVELTAKNYKKAQEYFGKSAGVGEALAEAQGVAYIQSGEYNKAVTAFGNSTSNNAALANLLAGNYQKATAVVDAVKNPTADTYYLKALIGARSSNKDQVISSLTKAIQADKSYAKKAACDIEFAKYLIDSDFLAIVK